MLKVLIGLALASAPPSLDAEIRSLQKAAVPDRTAYAIIESLTTEVGPRLAGSEAEARARAWAVAKMKALGFQNVRVETTPLEGWARGREEARVVAPFPQRLAVTALGLSRPTPPDGIEAEVVRFESLTALNEVPKDGLRGKIAFIDLAMPKTQDGSSYGAVVAIRSRGPSTAARKGAAALLIRSVGTDHHRFPHTGMLRYAEDAPRIPSAAVSAPDADQLGRMFALGKTIRVHLDLQPRDLGTQETGNVIGEVPGTTHPEEIILVGAHLDSWDLGTGAVDDGAGCGIVMAAAQLILRSAPRRPARTLRVVLFGAEEVGLIGAKAYRRAHEAELPLHRLAMESDFGAQPVYRISGRVGDGAWPGVEAFRQSHLARLRVIPGENGRAGGPDLSPLRGEVPILGLDQDGRDYFDLHHTADDTLDKIDAASLSQNVAAYASVMWWASETGVDLREELESDEARARPTPVR